MCIRAELHAMVDVVYDQDERPHLHEVIDLLRDTERLRKTLDDMQTIRSYMSQEAEVAS